MTTKTLGVLVFAVCGLMVLVGLVSPKPALSNASEGYGSVAVLAGGAAASTKD